MEGKKINTYAQVLSADENVSANAALLLLVCQLQQSVFLLCGNYPLFIFLCSKIILVHLRDIN